MKLLTITNENIYLCVTTIYIKCCCQIYNFDLVPRRLKIFNVLANKAYPWAALNRSDMVITGCLITGTKDKHYLLNLQIVS